MNADDENISTLLAMGFPEIEEIIRALRSAKNDLNEAVSILTHEAPFATYSEPDIDMKDVSKRPATADDIDGICEGGGMEFPVTNLYELDSRVFQDNWSIPYKTEESLGKCLIAAKRLAKEGLMEADENCKKFIERVLPEAFRKLLTSNATHRWQSEVQEGIYNMLDLFIDLITTRLETGSVPVGLLNILATAFDLKNDWNNKNKDQPYKGRWQQNSESVEYAQCSDSADSYGWLCDLINVFGDRNGFELIRKRFVEDESLTPRTMAALLSPVAQCCRLIAKDVAQTYLGPCMEAAFKSVKELDSNKTKEIAAVSDLLSTLKLLCRQFWTKHVESCDTLRLNMICRMLNTPMFSSRMNALKEVSRLIDESKSDELISKAYIGTARLAEWMSQNKVLSVALEGNIDQVQYTDRIRSIVEFLGPGLSNEELTKMWKLQETSPNVMDNVYGIMAGSANKFSLSQFELLTSLIKEKWKDSNDRVREKLLVLIGQIGKEAKQIKSTQTVLQLLWNMSHLETLPKHLVERAMSEHLSILNEMSFNRDAMRRTYVFHCVDDIKTHSPHSILPSVKHLHDICRSYSPKGGTSFVYQKTDKSTLVELNKQHEIVKLLSSSLRLCHNLAVKKVGNSSNLRPDSLVVDGRYTHEEYVAGHLNLMMFFLKEGDLYLSWNRCEELWDTLVDNPDAIESDKNRIFEWFQKCITDLERETQRQFFVRNLLKMRPDDVNEQSFNCFKAFFESINAHEGLLSKKTSASQPIVENLELAGLDYFWRLVTECERESIAELAIEYLLNLSYLRVTPGLKRDPVQLHRRFIDKCYSDLEKVFSIPPTASASAEKRDAAVLLEGCELETSVHDDNNDGDASNASSRTLTAISVSKVSSLPLQDKGPKLRKIRRLIHLAERYISAVDDDYDDDEDNQTTSILPHGASFHGRKIRIRVIPPKTIDEFVIDTHTNELVGVLKRKIASTLKYGVDSLSIQCGDVSLNAVKDRRLLGTILTEDSPDNDLTWTVVTGTNKPFIYEPKHTSASNHSLPGVVMASGGQVFTMLYQLATLNLDQDGDKRLLRGLRRLIQLIPTDPRVSETIEAISYHSSSSAAVAGTSSSPKLSPPKNSPNLEEAKRELANLFDANAEGMSSFRVLYNLEILSSKLMPTAKSPFLGAAQSFSQDFLHAGGLRLILNVFGKHALPPNIDYDIRQSAYLVALQLSAYLLCGQTVVKTLNACRSPSSSSSTKPTPPKKSAPEPSHDDNDVLKSPIIVSASKIVQTMSNLEFSDTVSCLLRVVWAAAAGKLHLASIVSGDQEPSTPSRSFYVGGRRSRDSSTGSSTGSEGSTTSLSSSNDSLHGGVCAQQSKVGPIDAQIAVDAFELLMSCLSLRSHNLNCFYNLPLINDFIIDTVLGSPSQRVRKKAAEQLIRLTKIKVNAPTKMATTVRRNLNMTPAASISSTPNVPAPTPKQFLTKILLKTPVPLWMPSCKARGISHSILSQCSEYFQLRCSILRNLSLREQLTAFGGKDGENDGDILDAVQMLEDELTFLQNYTPCQRLHVDDCTLLAGHLRLVEALVTCEGVDKIDVGSSLIEDLLNSFLFPASSIIMSANNDKSANNNQLTNNEINRVIMNPKCDTEESRVSAYDLLLELCRDCPENLMAISDKLISLHHDFNEDLAKDFEYEPAIDRRAPCNFVGLKNAGATCYMNSVLQQLYCVPGLGDSILGVDVDDDDNGEKEEMDESVFYQLQTVFGNLLESKLQSYTPERFWKCFKLFGRPVNVREQQDAFEFFTQIVNQVDEYLVRKGKSKIFSAKFEGVFSDQKICRGCPHRYEREQTFMALNLPVKSANLQESLDQFVKGELLEGDNAYYCEKCGQKRNAIKRMCIRTLPSTLVIQLKRFHYDWETNRAVKFDDFFQFPWTLEMGPYTSEGLKSNSKANNYPYDLVGVVVHSGQASAGHYYSFIKDRKSPVGGGKSAKWYKFNDTTVQEFVMNDETLSEECFGGTYKVKKTATTTSTSVTTTSTAALPEDRLRYWNAYMLLYEARKQKISKKSSSHAFRSLCSQRTTTTTATSTTTTTTTTTTTCTRSKPALLSAPPLARESFSQLTDLLEKGERKGLFAHRMPSAIEGGIQENNLKFLRNRDIYSDDYFKFVSSLIRTGIKLGERVQVVKLAVHFLFYSYLHLKRRDPVMIKDLIHSIESSFAVCSRSSAWFLKFLSESQHLFRPFILECTSREVRIHFSQLVERVLRQQHKKEDDRKRIETILGACTAIIEHDVVNNCKESGQIFWLISKYAQQGIRQASQLFKLQTFRYMIKFLLGVDPMDENVTMKPRRWVSSQAREFSELHSAIAHLILACDPTPYRSCKPEEKGETSSKNEETKCPMPKSVSSVLYGPTLAPMFVREAITACREISSSEILVRALVRISFCCRQFSFLLLEELMKQYNNVNSGELKNLSTLLIEILTLKDPLQADRISYAVEGEDIGLLQLVKAHQSTDSCRAYQCIKTLVTAANKSTAVKDYLLQDSGKWECAVNWLKSKMDDTGGTASSSSSTSTSTSSAAAASASASASCKSPEYYSYLYPSSSTSNEDSTTRTFQRTTSAQVTLDEANALMAEFGGGNSSMETEDVVTEEEVMKTDEDHSTSCDL